MSASEPSTLEDFEPCPPPLSSELSGQIAQIFDFELPPGLLGPPIPLGSGGQGRVFQLRDAQGRLFAFKRLSSETTPDRAALQQQRLKSEIGALEAFEHPHAAKLMEANEEKLWLLSDYIPGPTLSERLRLPQSLLDPAGQALSYPETLTLTITLARCLEELHSCGFAHRDLKPSNVILRGAKIDDPVIVDFGIACALAPPGSDQTGQMPHTPGRLNPNALTRSEAWRHDTYALGLIFAECLSAQFVARIPSLGPELLGGPASAQIVARALELAGNRPFQSMSEMRRELEDLQVAARKPAENLPKYRNSRSVASIALMILLGLVLARLASEKSSKSVNAAPESTTQRPPDSQPQASLVGQHQFASALRGCRFRPDKASDGAFALRFVKIPKDLNLTGGDLKIDDRLVSLNFIRFDEPEQFFNALLSPREDRDVELGIERGARLIHRRARMTPCLSIRGEINARLSLRRNTTDIYEIRGITSLRGSGNEVLSETDHCLLLDGQPASDPQVRAAFLNKRLGEATIFTMQTSTGPLINIVRHGSDQLLETLTLKLGQWTDARGRNLPKWSFLRPGGEQTIMSASDPKLPETNCVVILYEAVDREGYHIAAPLPGGSLLLQKLKNQSGRTLVSAYRMDDNPNFAGQPEWRFRFDQSLGERLSGQPHELFYKAARELNFQLVDQYTKHYSYQRVDPALVELIPIPARTREQFQESAAAQLARLDPDIHPFSFVWQLAP